MSLGLSVASAWEIQIKQGLGKWKLKRPLPELIENEVRANHMAILPVKLSHTYELGQLPHRHKDPFDQLLIAQARVEKMTLVTADRVLADYPVETLWKG